MNNLYPEDEKPIEPNNNEEEELQKILSESEYCYTCSTVHAHCLGCEAVHSRNLEELGNNY